MKRKDVLPLVVVGIIALVFSTILANVVFNPPKKRVAPVPSVDNLTSSFADVKNDPSYKNFLNEKALDPTQPIKIGEGTQTNPSFNSAQ